METEAGSAESSTEIWSKTDTFRLIELFKENQNAYRADGFKTKFWTAMRTELAKFDIIVSYL